MIEALERANQIGNLRGQCLCFHALGAVQYLLGEWAESRDAFEKSIDLAREVDSVFAEVLGCQRLAVLETGLGQYDTAHQRLLDTRELARSSDSLFVQIHSMTRIYGSLAQNRLEADDLAMAASYLAEGFTARQEFGECVTCDVLLYPSAVPIYIALGDFDQADWACRRIEETASGFGSRIWVAYARYLRGMLAAETQENEQAFRLLPESLTTFEELEQSYDIARSMEYLADVITRKGSTSIESDPEELLKQAKAIYARLGSTPNEDRVTSKLATHPK